MRKSPYNEDDGVMNVKDRFKQSYKLRNFESMGLAVYNCGVQSCEPGYQWGPAMRDHYLIHLITSGKGVFDTGKQTYPLSAGDGFLVTPSRVVSYHADADDPWEYSWVGFNGTDAERLMLLTGLSEADPTFHYDTDERLIRELETIRSDLGSSPSDEAKRQAYLLFFISSLMELFGREQTEKRGGFEYINKALRYIDYNYSRPIDVDDIAQSAGISRSHLYRLFVEHISMPPNEYLIRYRINKACALLRRPGIAVAEAAYSTGFSDQLYFSKVFKKYKGIPPSKFSAEKDASENQ